MISTEWLVLHAKTKPSILFSDGPKSYIWYFICSLFSPSFVSNRAFLQYLIPSCTVSSQFGLRGESQILKMVVSVPLGCRELNPPLLRDKIDNLGACFSKRMKRKCFNFRWEHPQNVHLTSCTALECCSPKPDVLSLGMRLSSGSLVPKI